MSLTTLQNAHLTVTIASRGAELQSIKDKNGFERLWQGDPAFWAGRAPILFPVAGGLREDCYHLDGERFEMPKHGYVRLIEWQLESATDTSAVFLMTEKHPGFPFDYELRACYTLEENALHVSYRVSNVGDRTFWFGTGAHEGYATPGGLENYTIEFDEVECLANYVLDGNLLKKEPVIMAEATDKMPLKTEYFAVDALVFRTLKSRGVTLTSKLHDRKVRVDFPGSDVLMFWMKPGAEYICIEPWINAPDFVDSDMQIEHKPGCHCLKPGETTDVPHTITIL